MGKRCLVTGVAGFIGSTLAERLVAQGDSVIGIDCFTDYYDPAIKRDNLKALMDSDQFELVESDIVTTDLAPLMEGTERVYHQAAQAGVRASWGQEFDHYTHSNINATQRLLEACRGHEGIRLVYASSSSVYGDVERVPMREDDRPAPHSPYGVSKLAAEHMCRLYSRNFDVETVSLRYFTVFGPRQRPDMAMHRLIRAGLAGGEVKKFGDGKQRRDFTHVQDIVTANIDAGERGQAGGVYNIGGGNEIDLNDLIDLIQKMTGGKATIVQTPAQPGDVRITMADVSAAQRDFAYAPRVSLEDGLKSEIEWMEGLLSQG